MANTTFSGPLRVGNPDGVTGVVTVARLVPLTVTAVANTDIVVPMPANYALARIKFVTATAFTGTTVTAQVGTTAGGSEVVAAVSVKAQGEVNATIVGTYAASQANATGSLHVRLAQTGATAVGAGTMIIEYVPLA